MGQIERNRSKGVEFLPLQHSSFFVWFSLLNLRRFKNSAAVCV